MKQERKEPFPYLIEKGQEWRFYLTDTNKFIDLVVDYVSFNMGEIVIVGVDKTIVNFKYVVTCKCIGTKGDVE